MNKEFKIEAKTGEETSIRQNNRILETEQNMGKVLGSFFKTNF